VKFLVDNALSPKLARILTESGHDTIHVKDCGLSDATDAEVIDRARVDSRTIITADADFGALLAVSRLTEPSVVLLREARPHRASQIADLVLQHLPQIDEELRRGSLVVMRQYQIRIRPLPIYPE
jgi:predicted nuclease of predicted toxin-antitoxin system